MGIWAVLLPGMDGSVGMKHRQIQSLPQIALILFFHAGKVILKKIPKTSFFFWFRSWKNLHGWRNLVPTPPQQQRMDKLHELLANFSLNTSSYGINRCLLSLPTSPHSSPHHFLHIQVKTQINFNSINHIVHSILQCFRTILHRNLFLSLLLHSIAKITHEVTIYLPEILGEKIMVQVNKHTKFLTKFKFQSRTHYGVEAW